MVSSRHSIKARDARPCQWPLGLPMAMRARALSKQHGFRTLWSVVLHPGEQAMKRRLAAILAADVVGYSRLMGEDEAGTLECLKAHRSELIDPKIAEHHGRIVKLLGDGVLVEFASVVDAVSCALHIQRQMAVRNANTPTARRIEFRIGINVGDIIVENDDIYGDGVNVAARLEAL